MALVDCTIIVEPSSVVVSTQAATNVQVTHAVTEVVVAGAAGIRGPQGPRGLSGLEQEVEMDLSLIYRLST